MVCLQCGIKLSKTTGLNFCCRAHRVRYNSRHNNCRTPEKFVFDTAGKVWEHIDENYENLRGDRTKIRPYRCDCMKFHYGHGEANEWSRIAV